MLVRAYLIASMLLVCVSAAETANAHAYKFCARVNAVYNDNDIGEELWEDDTYRPMSFAHVRVRHYPACSATGTFVEYVQKQPADVDGCTPSFSSSETGCFQLSVWSSGEVSDGAGDTIDVSVKNHDGFTMVTSPFVNGLQGSGGYLVDLSASEVRVLYVGLAFSIRRFNGYLDGHELRAAVYPDGPPSPCSVGCTCSGSGCACWSGGVARLCTNETSARRKFTIAHEWGHAMTYMAMQGYVPNGTGGGLYDAQSQALAIGESWADFVSADIFNRDDHSVTSGGGFYRGGDGCPTSFVDDHRINLEGQGFDSDCIVRYFHETWSPVWWPGRAVRLDWLRTWWDFHTDGSGSGRPDHDDMLHVWDELDELQAADNDDYYLAYDNLRQAVANAMSCTAYERLVADAELNGTNNCKTLSNCQDVNGCTDVDDEPAP